MAGSTTVGYTEGSGKNIVVYADASGNEHPAGLTEFLVGTTPTFVSSSNPFPVSLASLPALAAGTNAIGSITNTAFTANAGTNLNTSLLALETGGNLATIAAKDFATQTTLSALNAKVPALGQALAAASVPIVLTASQLTTLTPPAAITGFATASNQSAANTSLASIDAKLTACNTNSVQVASGSITANQGGSWTVTANAGTGTFTVAGNAASGASDSGNPVKVGGVYNTSAPTLTNAQRGDLQLDANGLLKVAIASGGGSGGTASSFGSAFPSTGTAIGAKDSSGTNMAALNLDASGYLKVNVAAGGAGGGAVTQSGTWTVQPGNTANTTAWLVTGTGGTFPITDSGGSITVDNGGTFATQDSQLVAQNSTTSGQVGPLAQGAVTTAAPTYTTAKTSPLSLTTAGALRVDASATTQPVSGTVSVNAGTGTFAISASALPLPSGASTAAKQPALGTAGAASSDVLTVQGIASMTALKVDGSAVTQPVSVASVPSHPVTNAGTFATQATLQSGTNTIGYVNAIQAGDTVEIAGTTYTVKNAFANATASGETTVVAAVASKKIRVLSFSIGPVSAAVNVYFDNATNGAICSTKYFGGAGAGMGRGLNHFGHFQTGTVNEALRVNLSATANVGVDVLYIEV